MAQCPSCHSRNVVVTEEVYTRKGRGYYRFLQTLTFIVIIGISVALEQLTTGILIAIGSSLIIGVMSLFNAAKRAKSRTKITCLACRTKQYL
jgi:hypothetical protein